MKRTVFTVIIMLILVMFFAACGWKVEIVDPTKPIENDSELVVSEEEEESKSSEEQEGQPEQPENEEQEVKEEESLPPIEGDFVVLETGKDFTMNDALLEFEDNFVIYSVDGEIAGFDKETGKKTYSTGYQNMNEIGFISMYKNEDLNSNGEHYCISSKDKIQYRTSEELYIVHEVPEEVGNIFFVGNEDFLWASEEGIMIIDFHGEEDAKVLVETERIKEEIRPICKKTFEEGFVGDNGVPYHFEDPKFICNETKIVVTVASEDYVFWAVAIYDIESDKFEKAFSFSEMDIAQYPIGDRYVFIRTTAGEKLVDVETFEERNFENFAGFAFMTEENIKFAVTELNNVGGGFKLYINESGKIEGEPVIKVTDPATSGYICGFTENYVLFHVYNAENEWDCAYRFF